MWAWKHIKWLQTSCANARCSTRVSRCKAVGQNPSKVTVQCGNPSALDKGVPLNSKANARRTKNGNGAQQAQAAIPLCGAPQGPIVLAAVVPELGAGQHGAVGQRRMGQAGVGEGSA